MIALARESRGLSQKELAEALKLSAAKLCVVEQEDQTLSDSDFEKMTKLLLYPKEFFQQEGEAYLPVSINFRKREKVAQKLLTPIEAQINVYRLNIERLAEKAKFPSSKVPVLDIFKVGSPQEAARQLRKAWKLPKGPVKNMTQLLEENGVIVVIFDFGTERVDSRTILTKDKHPVVVVNQSMLGDRQRFSLAHGLGHLVMHAFLFPSFERDMNHEANLFAAEFLMPENDIKKDFADGVTFQKLMELKRKWKVSMQAILYRAADLNVITPNQKRYLISQFHAMKIMRREPVELDIPKEKPRLLRDMITKVKTAQRLSVKEMATFLCLEEKEFIERFT
ncbi:MAG: ImmA/IrrE family metallo-endopeptidase [Bdellovibrionota bacterium]